MTGRQITQMTKGVMLSPKKKYYLGSIIHHTPYFLPFRFCKSILKIRKLILRPEEEILKILSNNQYAKRKDYVYTNLPTVRRSWNKIVKLFNAHYYIEWGYPISIGSIPLGYKTKWSDNDYRFEWCPMFYIYFFYWQFTIHWISPLYMKEDMFNDHYFEKFLFLKHYDMNVKEAKKNWKWKNSKGKSTWTNKYLLK